MVVDFELLGQRFVAINGGPQFAFNEAISLEIECADQEEIDCYWDALTDGGEEGACGWVKDRYGLSWQITPRGMTTSSTATRGGGAGAQAMFGMKKLDIAALQAAATACRPEARTVGGAMRIATWNVNSVKQRVPRLLPWLDERQPDVVCLQETKLADDAFAELLGAELADRGYEFAAHGEAPWNGVAILSRVGLEDVMRGLAGGPGFPDPEARAVVGDVRRHPRRLGLRAERPRARLRPLPLQARVARPRCATSSRPARRRRSCCGDMNIAPTDDDVFDPDAYVGQTHVTPPEREALADLQSLGLHDVVRDRWPDERVFTYWDYRAGMFHQDLGMRIDLILAGDAGRRAREGRVDRPPGPQGQGPERPRAGDRRPRRGARRRHRPGRPAALGARSRGAARRSSRSPCPISTFPVGVRARTRP